jgi:hypothetical protein
LTVPTREAAEEAKHALEALTAHLAEHEGDPVLAPIHEALEQARRQIGGERDAPSRE